MGISKRDIIMSRSIELLIFASLLTLVVKADNRWSKLRGCFNYRCPRGFFCNFRIGECEIIPTPKSCACEGNKLIVEGSSFVPTKEACQRKCQKQRSCKFFTYNLKSCTCGLRTFTPGGRAFSFGNVSGLKYESPSQWKSKVNSVYVGKLVTAYSCSQCSNLCMANSRCRSMIYNNLYKQCSFNYGTGNLRTITLPSNFRRFGISSAKNC